MRAEIMQAVQSVMMARNAIGEAVVYGASLASPYVVFRLMLAVYYVFAS